MFLQLLVQLILCTKLAVNQKSEYPKYLAPQKEQLLHCCLHTALLADAKGGGCVQASRRVVRFESHE